MALREAGLPITDREFEIKYLEADYKLYLKHKTNGGMTPADYRKWFLPILYESLPIEEDVDLFRDRVRAKMGRIEFTRKALPGVVDLLDDLKTMDYKLGVISNNDGYTEDKCEEVGIDGMFDFILDSTKIDMIKPDQRIFHKALKESGLSPGEVIHIGDMFGSDIMGAHNAGIDAIWMNSREIDSPSGQHVKQVRSLSEIKSAL